MTLRNLGVLDWDGGREMDLHRTYHVRFLIESSSANDGPQCVTFAPGLPNIGATWTYGNDNDSYAVCTPIVECETVLKREPNFWWILKYTFTTKPWLACYTSQLTHPASQPDYVGGSFVGYQERTCKRRDGKPIVSSSLEPIWVQRDKSRPTLTVTQTRLNLELNVFSQMIDTLNDAPLWGLSKRCIKLRNVPWRRLVWGQCGYYYERTLEFDIRYETFDETKIRDEGHREVNPELFTIDADPAAWNTDPQNFTRSCDSHGNPNKIILLDGAGSMCLDPVNHEHYIAKVELYDESNFLQLGIPVIL